VLAPYGVHWKGPIGLTHGMFRSRREESSLARDVALTASYWWIGRRLAAPLARRVVPLLLPPPVVTTCSTQPRAHIMAAMAIADSLLGGSVLAPASSRFTTAEKIHADDRLPLRPRFHAILTLPVRLSLQD
jgi:hypothetical protein